jgi:hypothetical protein
MLWDVAICESMSDELDSISSRQWPERHFSHNAVASEIGHHLGQFRPGAGGVAEGDNDAQWCIRCSPSEREDEVESVGTGPLQIVEEHEKTVIASEIPEEAGERCDHQPAFLAIVEPDESGSGIHHVGQLRE